VNRPKLVPSPAVVRVTATFPLTHLCPFAQEIDRGSVTISWTTLAGTIELHSLRDYLAGFAVVAASHEEITGRIEEDLLMPDVIADVQVTTRWQTAGAEVVVTSAVPGERVEPAGA
jgi:NADPH-dependent 7-cyano-7-deazaguanine reductase QueF